MNYQRTGLILFLLFLSSGVFSQSIYIKIIETSDVHGALFPFDFIQNKKADGSLAQVHTYVEEQRKILNQEVILIDNGDIMQGDPSVYFYNSPDSAVNVLSDIMNFMDYDLAVVGNHDIEQGHSSYDKFRDELEFPWLAANAISITDSSTYFDPYVVIKKKGLKIAFLGLITPAIPQWLHPKLYEGMYFEDMIESAAKWVDTINARENPDVLIGVFHAGVDYTYNGEDDRTPCNENASELVAKKVDGFDIVFVGHDHRGWNKSVVNDFGREVLLLGPSSKARNVAVADLILTRNRNSGNWDKEISGQVVSLEDVDPSHNFVKRYSDEIEYIRREVDEKIGYLQNDILTREALFGTSAYLELIHRVQMEFADAEISMASPMSFNSTLHEGDLRYADVFKLYRYENLLYKLSLTGKEIDAYLEYSYGNWFNELKNDSSHLLMFELNDEGNLVQEKDNRPLLIAPYYNFDCASGITYEVDLSKPVGNRVEIYALYDGKPFELNNTYTVAMNSYRGNGGGGHLHQGAGIPEPEINQRIVWVSDHDMRHYITTYIQNRMNITPVKSSNWKILPEDRYKNALNLDYMLLFGN